MVHISLPRSSAHYPSAAALTVPSLSASQLAAVATTLGISIFGGYLTGKACKVTLPDPYQPFDDEEFWEVPQDEKEKGHRMAHPDSSTLAMMF